MKTLVATVALLLTSTIASAQTVGGNYTVSGTNLNGSRYAGDATITLSSDYTCNIVWKTGSSTSSGICMRDGNALAAGYELNGKVGLVIYMIQGDGTLDGTWTIDGVNAFGTEILTPN